MFLKLYESTFFFRIVLICTVLLTREAAIASVKNGYFCLENLKFLSTIL